jgi:hypothetical protein
LKKHETQREVKEYIFHLKHVRVVLFYELLPNQVLTFWCRDQSELFEVVFSYSGRRKGVFFGHFVGTLTRKLLGAWRGWKVGEGHSCSRQFSWVLAEWCLLVLLLPMNVGTVVYREVQELFRLRQVLAELCLLVHMLPVNVEPVIYRAMLE